MVGGKIKGERNCGYAQMEDSECKVEFNVILVQFEQWRKMQTKLACASFLLLLFKGATSRTTHLEKIGNFFFKILGYFRILTIPLVFFLC